MKKLKTNSTFYILRSTFFTGFTLIRTLLRKNLVNVRGFTLIELLVVISIIGILAAIGLVSYTGAQRQARDTQRKSDIKQYQTTLETYAGVNNDLYPGTFNAAVIAGTTGAATLCNALGLSTCSRDPSQPTYDYRYRSNGVAGLGATATQYVLYAYQENASNYFIVCSNGKTGTGGAPASSNCPI